MKRTTIIPGLFLCLFLVGSDSLAVQSNRHMMTLDRHYYTKCDGLKCCFETYPEPESYFYASDEAAWLWFNWHGARPGESLEMLYFAPDGSLYNYISGDSYIDREDGCLLISFSINGSSSENLPGNWRIDVSIGGNYLFSQCFNIVQDTRDSHVAKTTMTLDPGMNGDCTTPPPNYIFYDHDEEAYFWFYFNGVDTGGGIRIEWYDPHGSLYLTQSGPSSNGNGCWNPGIPISGHQAEHLPGTWRVSLYYGGNRHLTEYFSIVDTTPAEPITCPLSLIYGNDSLQTEALRTFRDTVLSRTPEGRELIQLYYLWSPTIAGTMEQDKELKQEIKNLADIVLQMIEGAVE